MDKEGAEQRLQKGERKKIEKKGGCYVWEKPHPGLDWMEVTTSGTVRRDRRGKGDAAILTMKEG